MEMCKMSVIYSNLKFIQRIAMNNLKDCLDA